MTNESTEHIVALNLKTADTFSQRFRGLMMQKEYPSQYDALLLTPCNSIHTVFMRFPIDVVFLSRENEVVHIIENMKPAKVSPVVKKARSVIEFAAGTVAKHNVKLGDLFIWDQSGKVVKQ
jgi:uncharacterized protein